MFKKFRTALDHRRKSMEVRVTPAAITLTSIQRLVLTQIKHSPKSTTAIVESINLALSIDSTTAQESTSYDSVHGILRRLEDKGAVRRTETSNSTHWELTQAGRWAVNSDS